MFAATTLVSNAVGFSSINEEIESRTGLIVFVGGLDRLDEVASFFEDQPARVGHWLAEDEAAVERARSALQERGLYGRISVEPWNSPRLPYTDNLVNAMIVRDGGPFTTEEEILRVLVPNGVAMVQSGGQSFRIEKPRPEEMGEWTHPWARADGSLVAPDRALDVPNGIQWLAGPSFPFSQRKDSTGAAMSAGGRIFYITRNAPANLDGNRSQDHLVARDAFNGTLLWSQPWEGPLSRGHRAGVHEAVVVDDQHVYAARDGEIVVLNAANGEALDAWSTDNTPRKLLISDGVLVAETDRGLVAFDLQAGQGWVGFDTQTQTGQPLWKAEARQPSGTLVRDGRVFFLEGSRQKDGRWQHELVAVSLENGEPLWRADVESEFGVRNSPVLRLHFAGDGIVCLIERTNLRFLSTEDGTELWSHESQAEARGEGSMDSRQVGHFFVNDQVWLRGNRARGGREAEETWLAFAPLTGEIERELRLGGAIADIGGSVNKVSCQPLTATERFVFDARLATIWDFEGGQREGFKFVRGGCQSGMIPANGLAYVPPNACGCLEEQIRGFVSVVHRSSEGMTAVEPGDLERGPAYGSALTGELEDGWHVYRGDGRRLNHAANAPGSTPSPQWTTSIELNDVDTDVEWQLGMGMPLTQAVIGNGSVFLARPQTHQVIALNESNGNEKWTYTAGGRITTPPTLHRGLVLFGAHDGYVYALSAEDGSLAWRRRAAPADDRIMVYGQLESVWPVKGGVLVHDGVGLVAAGRTGEADGGILVHAFDPQSGRVIWSQRVTDASYGTCDLLVSDGSNVYLINQRLDLETGKAVDLEFGSKRTEREGTTLRFPRDVRYLRGGKAGLLDTSWTRIEVALRKAISTWNYSDIIEGEMIAANGDTAFAFQIETGDRMFNVPRTSGGGHIKARRHGDDNYLWQIDLAAPQQVEAILASNGGLWVAGPEDRDNPAESGFLTLLDVRDGSEMARLQFDAPVVHDGLAAANGKLFAVLRSGEIHCLGE